MNPDTLNIEQFTWSETDLPPNFIEINCRSKPNVAFLFPAYQLKIFRLLIGFRTFCFFSKPDDFKKKKVARVMVEMVMKEGNNLKITQNQTI
jgi:hypothetical protein